jgi:hypothetical protein
MVERDHGFGGSSGGGCSDPAAHQHGLTVLVKLEFSTIVFPVHRLPVLDQRADFPFQGGDDGDS